ncbi:MAG: SDR family oxidoreductase [Thermoplasmata archaeon]|nr:SDR family oxidoreductase [Thermoplasmata archaeon]
MEINLDGKVAIVTASSKGIGFGVAKVFSMCNANVILLSRNEENLRIAAEKIETISGSKPKYIVADLTDKKQLENAIEEIKREKPSIFFFSTGGVKPGYFMEMRKEDWDKAINLLLHPAIYLTKELLPDMIKRKWGRIIYLTSTAIKEVIPNIALSNVVRITMAGLVRTLAKEVGMYGITVNGIMPGMIKTDRIIQLARDKAKREGITMEEALKNLSATIPAARLGMPEEIGYFAAFLANDFASYINGALIPVDGGKLNSTL